MNWFGFMTYFKWNAGQPIYQPQVFDWTPRGRGKGWYLSWHGRWWGGGGRGIVRK